LHFTSEETDPDGFAQTHWWQLSQKEDPGLLASIQHFPTTPSCLSTAEKNVKWYLIQFLEFTSKLMKIIWQRHF